MSLQSGLALTFMLGGWIIAGVTNGDLRRPIHSTGAFASVACILMSIAISCLRFGG